MSITKQQALEAIDRNRDLVIRVSDDIWDNPETAFEEFKSVDIHCAALEEAGFTVERGVGDVPTAFTGTWGSGAPKIGLLAEFDALSGLSQKAGCAERTAIVDGGCGHGCGHNLLGAGCLAAAIGIKEYLEKNNLPGTVVFYGCPGEEGGSGKAFMAREGVFDGLDVALAWHPGTANDISMGSFNANIQLYYKFHGVAVHAGAAPWDGRSALDALTLLNIGVQFLREHVTPDVRIHYAITNTGGYSPNVVQAYAEAIYLIRAKSVDAVQKVYERVNKIADGAAMMTETTVEKDVIKACSNIVPNLTLCELVHDNLEEIGIPELSEEDYAFAKQITETYPDLYEKAQKEAFAKIEDPEVREKLKAEWSDKPIHAFLPPVDRVERHSGGSSDVGDVSCIAPTVMFFASTNAVGTPGHSWQYVAQGKQPLAHKFMLYAAKGMAGAAIDMIENPALLQKAKAEHAERMGYKPYVCPIPAGVKPRGISVNK